MNKTYEFLYDKHLHFGLENYEGILNYKYQDLPCFGDQL